MLFDQILVSLSRRKEKGKVAKDLLFCWGNASVACSEDDTKEGGLSNLHEMLKVLLHGCRATRFKSPRLVNRYHFVDRLLLVNR